MKNVSLNIELEKQNYLPGETVKGNLTVVLEKAIKARKIEVKLEGREYTVINRESDRASSAWNWVSQLAIPSGSGQAGSTFHSDNVILEASMNAWASSSVESLGPGEFTYPFEFVLPVNAIPSMGSSFTYTIPDHAAEKGITRTIPNLLPGSIVYSVMAKIDVPRAIDPKAQAAVNVNLIPRSDIASRALGSRLSIDEGNVCVEASVDKDVFTPGDTITGKITFRKEPSENVRAVEVALRFILMTVAQGQIETFEQACDVITFPIPSDENEFTSDFALESFPDGPFSMYGILVKIMWLVDIKVDIMHKLDKHARIPLHAIPIAEIAEPATLAEPTSVEWIEVNVPESEDTGNQESIDELESLYKAFKE